MSVSVSGRNTKPLSASAAGNASASSEEGSVVVMSEFLASVAATVTGDCRAPIPKWRPKRSLSFAMGRRPRARCRSEASDRAACCRAAANPRLRR